MCLMPGTLILLSALVSIASAAPNDNRIVIGRWRSVQTSGGGIGGTFWFREDGTLEFSPGAVVAGKYRVEGNRLILPPGTINGPEQVMAIESVTAEKLRLRWLEPLPRIELEAVELTREGQPPDAQNVLLGSWMWPGSRMWPGKIQSLSQFRADGTALLIARFKTFRGRYMIAGDQIHLEIEEQPPVKGKFRLENGLLFLPDPQGKAESPFERY